MGSAGRLSVTLALLVVAACGASTSKDNSTGQTWSDDAGVDAGAADGAGDAYVEPPDDGPWPAPHYPMPMVANLGGKLLASPQVVTVTFVGNANKAALQAFDDSLVQANNPWWTAVTAGYGVGPGTGGVYVELPDTVSNTTIDDGTQLQPMIAQWVASGALPAPNANSIYVIYFPASTTITLMGSTSCSAFGAYHNSTTIPLEAGTVDSAYAVIPDCNQGMAELTDSASHELIEAATDPHPMSGPTWYGTNFAWWPIYGSNGTQSGGEVADLCERYAPVSDTGGNAVARAWVNQAAAASHDPCQPTPSGEIFYAAAVPTQVIKARDSDGYVIVKPGASTTLDVVVFSEAKLPNDVALSVGTRQRGTTALGPIATGITATLSPTTGHNGVHVQLAIQVAAGTTAGDYPFVVRAALGASDHHDWPAIVHVP